MKMFFVRVQSKNLHDTNNNLQQRNSIIPTYSYTKGKLDGIYKAGAAEGSSVWVGKLVKQTINFILVVIINYFVFM